MYSFEHLLAMSDGNGLFEHAERDWPRREHGYCVDDVARGLVVLSREQAPGPELMALGDVYLRFLIAAQANDGCVRNRMNAAGRWSDRPALDDAWGRAMWGFGSAAAHMPQFAMRALAAFERGTRRRSPFLHGMAFAGLGAAEVLSVRPGHTGVRGLLRDAAEAITAPGITAAWPWPEPRLRYANAAFPETLMRAGQLLDEPRWVRTALHMLEWLVERETHDGHLSVTPVGGWGPGEPRPGFDQQPIEVAALADACATAYAITNEREWLHVVERCAAWFDGANDVGIAMTDAAHTGAYDGLTREGRNENRGAESTLALLSTMQQLQRIKVHT